MRKSVKKRTLSFALALMLFGVTGCGQGKSDTGITTEARNGALYTYNEYISKAPVSWNPHIGDSDADSYVQGYTEMGLYAISLADDLENYSFVDEMAVGDPADVTADYVEKYGISEGETGKAWEIALNPDAVWANGEAITAEDYLWSMEQLLNTEMQNKKATAYYTGDSALYKAKDYYIGNNAEYTKIPVGTVYSDEEIAAFVAENRLFFSLSAIPFLDEEGAHTLSSYHDLAENQMKQEEPKTAIYSLFFADRDYENGTDITAVLSGDGFRENVSGYVPVTAENLEQVKEALGVFTSNVGSLGVDAGEWYNLCAVSSEADTAKTAFDEVGIFATGDLKFVLVFENAQTLRDVKNLLCTNWIVYRPYYEEGFSYVGDLKVTNYGTASGNYMAYGPYVLEAYQTDKELVFAKNDSWYGYQEDKTNYHEGQYQTSRIVSQIIDQQSTALLEFEKGNLDQVRLASTDLDKYKFSDYLLTRTGGNIWQIAFNSDAEKLADIESDGQGNRRVLSIQEFRKGLSLSLNRADIGKSIMVGSKPAYALINENYYYDLENDMNSIYRDTDAAKEAITDLYGIRYGAGETYATLEDAYQSVTGYDITEATACFEAAYEYAVANGLYTDGEKIQINIYNNAQTAALTALGEYMQSQVNLATEGTGFEGKITVSIKAQESGRLEAIRDGKIEAAYYSRSSSYDDPYGLIGTYVNAAQEVILECGFDPSTENVAITYDFDGNGSEETLEKTYLDWQMSTVAGGTYADDVETKLHILARLENALLGGFRTLPVCVGTDVLLYSQKVEYATTDANTFAAYGGIRLMTYNYDDAAWKDYCAKGSLSYE